MKKIISTLLLVTALSGIGGVALSAPAQAAKCGQVETSIDFGCKPTDTGANTVTSLLLTIINFLAIGVGIAVVGGIVFGALQYTSANGNASQAQQGITIITNAVIGLVLFILMYAIINFLVPGGLFT